MDKWFTIQTHQVSIDLLFYKMGSFSDHSCPTRAIFTFGKILRLAFEVQLFS